MSIDLDLLRGSLNPFNILKVIKFRIDFIKSHPDFFNPEGLLVFCGSQGSGKTLSAVQYSIKCLDKYEMSIFCTNVEIKEYPINCYYKRKTIKDNETGIEKNVVDYFTINNNDLVRTVTSWYENGEQKSDIKDFPIYGFNGRIVIEYNGIDCLKEIENRSIRCFISNR